MVFPTSNVEFVVFPEETNFNKQAQEKLLKLKILILPLDERTGNEESSHGS
jgi:hypothetical protein